MSFAETFSQISQSFFCYWKWPFNLVIYFRWDLTVKMLKETGYFLWRRIIAIIFEPLFFWSSVGFRVWPQSQRKIRWRQKSRSNSKMSYAFVIYELFSVNMHRFNEEESIGSILLFVMWQFVKKVKRVDDQFFLSFSDNFISIICRNLVLSRLEFDHK